MTLDLTGGGEPVEHLVGELLASHGWTIGVAESMTGGMISERLTEVSGSSSWFRGGIVSYASDLKFELLGVPKGPVISAEAALAMARGVREMLHTNVGISVTGVAGPGLQEDKPVGLVFAAVALPDIEARPLEMNLIGDRQRIRELACAHVLDLLRQELLTNTPANG